VLYPPRSRHALAAGRRQTIKVEALLTFPFFSKKKLSLYLAAHIQHSSPNTSHVKWLVAEWKIRGRIEPRIRAFPFPVSRVAGPAHRIYIPPSTLFSLISMFATYEYCVLEPPRGCTTFAARVNTLRRRTSSFPNGPCRRTVSPACGSHCGAFIHLSPVALRTFIKIGAALR
jgi:hypothetical protein